MSQVNHSAAKRLQNKHMTPVTTHTHTQLDLEAAEAIEMSERAGDSDEAQNGGNFCFAATV